MKKENKKKLLIFGALGVGIVTTIALMNNKPDKTPGNPAGSGSAPNPAAPGRGLRNNNPTNIKISTIPWLGKIPTSINTDQTFEQFSSMSYGFRAAIKNLRSYVNQGITDMDSIIQTWAPDSTGNYQTFVKNYMNLDPNKNYDLSTSFFNKEFTGSMLSAMATFENGSGSAAYVNSLEPEFVSAWNML